MKSVLVALPDETHLAIRMEALRTGSSMRSLITSTLTQKFGRAQVQGEGLARVRPSLNERILQRLKKTEIGCLPRRTLMRVFSLSAQEMDAAIKELGLIQTERMKGAPSQVGLP